MGQKSRRERQAVKRSVGNLVASKEGSSADNVSTHLSLSLCPMRPVLSWISRQASNHASEPVQCWVERQPRFWKADNLLSWTDPPWQSHSQANPPTSPRWTIQSPPPYSQPSRHKPPQQTDNQKILPPKKRRRSPRQDPGRTVRQELWRKAEERNFSTRQVLQLVSGWHRVGVLARCRAGWE